MVRTWAAGGMIFTLLYAFFLAIHVAFPFLESGEALVLHLKHDLARRGQPFSQAKRLRIMAFGHSQVLAGFVPAQFDRDMAEAGIPGVESYNFGLPGDSRFMADLEAMAARGTAPDIALLIVPWPAQEEAGESFFHFVNHDQEVMNRLFPFRKLPRDLILMASESRWNIRAFRHAYQESEQSLAGIVRDRGYYFLARQSHYPNDQLPPDWRDPGDTPWKCAARDIPRGPVFDRLASLCAAHGIRCLLVPAYVRKGQFAVPPPVNGQAVAALAGNGDFGVAGPDYFVYPNDLFSDPAHVNRHGAQRYTRDLARLVSHWIQQHPANR